MAVIISYLVDGDFLPTDLLEPCEDCVVIIVSSKPFNNTRPKEQKNVRNLPSSTPPPPPPFAVLGFLTVNAPLRLLSISQAVSVWLSVFLVPVYHYLSLNSFNGSPLFSLACFVCQSVYLLFRLPVCLSCFLFKVSVSLYLFRIVLLLASPFSSLLSLLSPLPSLSLLSLSSLSPLSLFCLFHFLSFYPN